MLSGSEFNLRVGEADVNLTGRVRTALTINGSLPGPLLRWKEGDTITLNVANDLDEDTSIHWHGILLPANMDGVPGLSFPGIHPGQAYRLPLHGEAVRHLLVPQPLGLSGAAGRLRSARHRAPRSGASSVRPRARGDAHGLDGRTPGTHVREAEEAVRLLQLPSAHARHLHSRRAEERPERHTRRTPHVGRDADARRRPGRRHGLHLHLPDERPRAGGQLDRPVRAGREGAAAIHQRLGDVVLRRSDSRPEDDRRGRGRVARAAGHHRRVSHRRRGDVRRDRRADWPGRVHDLRAGDGSHRVRGRHACHAGRTLRTGTRGGPAPGPDHGRHGTRGHGRRPGRDGRKRRRCAGRRPACGSHPAGARCGAGSSRGARHVRDGWSDAGPSVHRAGQPARGYADDGALGEAR